MLAMSSAITRPGRHWAASISAANSGLTQRRSWRSVITQPGTIELTRMPGWPTSPASERVSPRIADLQAG